MTKTELIEAVIKEATLLKEHATPEELGRLNFEWLHPGHPNLCIYGQMTGYCFSMRSYHLIDRCAPTFVIETAPNLPLESIPVLSIPVLSIPVLRCSRGRMRNYSPIEAYIYQPYAKNKILVRYIKGKIDELTPEDLI